MTVQRRSLSRCAFVPDSISPENNFRKVIRTRDVESGGRSILIFSFTILVPDLPAH